MTNEKVRNTDGKPLDWADQDARTQELVNAIADPNGLAVSRRDIQEAAAKRADSGADKGSDGE